MKIWTNILFFGNHILLIVALLVAVCLTLYGLGNVLESVTYADCLKWDMREILDRKEAVEMVLVGNSRVYKSFIPAVLEERLGFQNVLNGGSSYQTVYGTYYQLKDFLEKFHPRQAVIGVTWDGLATQRLIIKELIVYDRLSLHNKLAILMDAIPGEEKLLALKAYRYRENLFCLSDVLRERQAFNAGEKPVLDTEIEFYAGKGFVSGKQINQTGTLGIDAGKSKKWQVDDNNLGMLRKCISLCREQGVDVCLVTGPISMSAIYTIRQYQEAVEFYQGFAMEQGVDYYNLNYYKGREKLLPDEKMMDIGHVNGDGARTSSEILAQILRDRAEEKDTSHYFYANLEEMKQDVHRIVAVSESTSRDSQDPKLLHMTLYSLHNDDVTPEYQIELLLADGTEQILVPWTTEKAHEIEVPDVNDENSLKIRARADIPGYQEAFQIIPLIDFE